jgi:hypothetical protein
LNQDLNNETNHSSAREASSTVQTTDQRTELPVCFDGLSTEFSNRIRSRLSTEQIQNICKPTFQKIQAPDISLDNPNPFPGVDIQSLIRGMEFLLPKGTKAVLITDPVKALETLSDYYKKTFGKDLVKLLEKNNSTVEDLRKKFEDTSQVRAFVGAFDDDHYFIALINRDGNIYNPMMDNLSNTPGLSAIETKFKSDSELMEYLFRFTAYHEVGHVNGPSLAEHNEARADAIGSMRILADGLNEGKYEKARACLELKADIREALPGGLSDDPHIDGGKAIREVLALDPQFILSLTAEEMQKLATEIAVRSVPPIYPSDLNMIFSSPDSDKNTLSKRNSALANIEERLRGLSFENAKRKIELNKREFTDPELAQARIHKEENLSLVDRIVEDLRFSNNLYEDLKKPSVKEVFDRAIRVFEKYNAELPPYLRAIDDFYFSEAKIS